MPAWQNVVMDEGCDVNAVLYITVQPQILSNPQDSGGGRVCDPPVQHMPVRQMRVRRSVFLDLRGHRCAQTKPTRTDDAVIYLRPAPTKDCINWYIQHDHPCAARMRDLQATVGELLQVLTASYPI